MVRALVLVVLVVKCVSSGWFDIVDIEDPLAAIWAQKPEERTECRVNTPNGAKYGTCTSTPSCLLQKGQPTKKCNFFNFLGTCCIYERTCGKSVNTKVSYFEGEEVTTGGKCKFVVKLKNPNVCQVRLDFVKFNLAPPTYDDTALTYKCTNDKLVITPNFYGIPDLCNTNDKQHVYVHINQTDQTEETAREVKLEFTLADRATFPTLTPPSWKIKVTQLECPVQRGKFSWANGNADEAAQDFNLLAPLGVIQYFTHKSGHFKSFGYDGAVQSQLSYTNDQFYAIGFRRYQKTCSVRFTPEYMAIHNEDPVNGLNDESQCVHYLFIPELQHDQANVNFRSRICLDNTPYFEFRSSPPGPFLIHFNSKLPVHAPVNTEQQYGFNIKYELLNC